MTIVRKIPWALQQDLVRAFFFEDGGDGGKTSDSVQQGQFATVDVGCTRLFPYGFDIPRNDGIEINVDNDRGTPFDFNPDGKDQAFSVFSHFRFDGITNGNEFTLSCNATNNGINVWNLLLSDTTPDDGLPHTLLVTVSRSSLVAYLDGKFLGEQTTPANSNGMNNHLFRYDSQSNQWELIVGSQTIAANIKNIMIGGTPQKVADRWDGPIYASLYWHRKLCASDAKWLHRNYRLLKRSHTQFIPTIVPPNTFGVIPKRIPWTSKPPEGTQIDRSTEIGQRVVSAFAFNEGGRDVVDLANGELMSNNGADQDTGELGRQLRFVDGNTDYIRVPSREDFNFGNEGFTILQLFTIDTVAADYGLVSKHLAAGSWSSFYTRFRATGDKFRLSVQDNINSEFPNFESSDALLADTPYAIACCWKKDQISAADASIAINGKIQTISYSAGGYSSAFTYRFNSADAVAIGRQENDTPSKYLDGTFRLLVFIKGRLSDAALINLTKNPWQLFEPRTIFVPVGYVAAAGGTINTVTLSDDLAEIVDSLLVQRFINRQLDSNPTITDGLLSLRTRERFLDFDSVDLGDTILDSKTRNRQGTDTIDIADSLLSLQRFRNRTLSDNIELSDNLIALRLRYGVLTDNETITDSILATYIPGSGVTFKTLSDTITASDSILAQRFRDRILTSLEDITDGTLVQRFRERNPTADNITATDFVEDFVARNVRLGDSIDLTDDGDLLFRLRNRMPTDNLDIAGSILPLRIYRKVLGDSTDITDSIASLFVPFEAVAVRIRLSDDQLWITVGTDESETPILDSRIGDFIKIGDNL